MNTFLYIWATVAITLFTLAFIISYEIDSGYRHTLQIAVLSLGWLLVLPAIVVVFATVTFLEFRRAGRHLAASQTRDAARSNRKQKSGTREHGDPATDAQAGARRHRAGIARAYC